MTKLNELIIEPHRWECVQPITGAVMRHVEVDSIDDLLRDQVLFRFGRDVMSHKVEGSEHQWCTEPVWEDARAHYVSTLPEGFRKRFLMYFWGLTPEDLKPKRIKHTVTVNRWARLPELPPTVGRAYYQQILDHESTWV